MSDPEAPKITYANLLAAVERMEWDDHDRSTQLANFVASVPAEHRDDPLVSAVYADLLAWGCTSPARYAALQELLNPPRPSSSPH